MNAKEKLRTRTKISFSFLIPYLCVLAMPMVIALLIYFQTVATIKTQTLHLNQAAQSQAVTETENEIAGINQMALQIYQTSAISALTDVKNPDFTPKDILRLIQSVKSITAMNVSSLNQTNLLLLFPKSNLALSNHRLNTDIEFAYTNFFFYADTPYSQWIERVLHTKTISFYPAEKISLTQGQQTDAITYVIPIRMNHDEIYALFLIDTKQLHKRISHGNENHQTCLIDEHGTLLYYSGTDSFPLDDIMPKLQEQSGMFEYTIGAEKQVITYTKSQNSGWTYLSVVPVSVVYGSLYVLSGKLITLWAIAALLGLISALLFTRRTAQPVSRMASRLNEQAPLRGDLLKRISQNVDELVTVNEDMTTRILQQNMILNATFVERVLNGRMDQLQLSSHSLDNPLEGFEKEGYEMVVALVSQSDGEMEMATLQQDCQDVLSEIPGILSYVHILGHSEVALILSADDAVVENKMDTVFKGLYAALPGHVDIAVGSPCHTVETLSKSFDSARFALNYMQATSCGEVLWYNDIPADRGAFVYPLETEQHILSNVLAGNEEELLEIKKQLYTENFVKADLTVGMKKCFLYNLFSTIMKLLPYKSDIFQSVSEFRREFLLNIDRHGHHYEETYAAIFQKFLDIAKDLKKGKRSHNQEMAENIRHYINRHFFDNSLSVDAIAEQYGISQSYLSQLFKEQTGQNVSDYLESIRIAAACRLFQTTAMPIQEVAVQCGYGNVYTFRRAFKRVKGIVPTEYKIQHENGVKI